MLNFSDVVVAIQGKAILRRVSFHIDSGQTVALVGRNGAGKTTILRAIMGLTNVVSGQISFEARDISRMPPHQRPGLGIGYAPDDRRLFSAFTVEENIRLPAEVARLSPERIAKRLHEIYELVPELVDLGPRPAGQISGGQGKIVALGSALMIGSRLILLDDSRLSANYRRPLRGRAQDTQIRSAPYVNIDHRIQPIIARSLERAHSCDRARAPYRKYRIEHFGNGVRDLKKE
jgi:branched-chain amino acid transport system ATP-binding protein